MSGSSGPRPDREGIKTGLLDFILLLQSPGRALIEKGLRRVGGTGTLNHLQSGPRPDREGIKTKHVHPYVTGVVSGPRPDREGIKTMTAWTVSSRSSRPDRALIEKGLRQWVDKQKGCQRR